MPSAHAVDREYKVIGSLYGERFPVSQPLLYCSDESIVGTAFFVMAFVEGRVFWEPQMPQSHPAERAKVYDAMNATLARLHTFDPARLFRERDLLAAVDRLEGEVRHGGAECRAGLK